MGVLVVAVVVFGSGDCCPHFEGVVVADGEGVGSGFAGGVGVAGVDGGVFGVGSVEDLAVDFVGADVDEGFDALAAGVFEDVGGSEDVGLDEWCWVADAVVYVGFGGEVDDGVDAFA